MSWPTDAAEHASARIQVVSSTTTTVLKTSLPYSPVARYVNHWLNTVTAEQILFDFGVAVLLYSLIQKIRNPSETASHAHEDAHGWDAPWLTLDLAALYGLFRLAHEQGWRQTPFLMHKVIQEHWNLPHRPWLRRLLGMGIIPLYIQDGGMDFELPRYQQAKQRAYIEFVVPYRSIDARMEEFIQRVIDSRVEDKKFRDHNFAVLLRYSPPTRGGRLFYSEANPPLSENRPFTVSAQSVVKWLLPFLPDKVLRKGLPDAIVRQGNKHIGPSLALYVKGPNASKVTILERLQSILIRVEAQHYGICEIDAYLYGIAQEVGLTVQWPEDNCQRAAEEELARCGLPISGPDTPEAVSEQKFW